MKSPTATELGPEPAAKLVAALKLPVPVPSKIETLLESKFASARSSLPSPLKSPATRETGFPPVKLVAAAKLAVLHCDAMLGATVKFAVAFVVRSFNVWLDGLNVPTGVTT